MLLLQLRTTIAGISTLIALMMMTKILILLLLLILPLLLTSCFPITAFVMMGHIGVSILIVVAAAGAVVVVAVVVGIKTRTM